MGIINKSTLFFFILSAIPIPARVVGECRPEQHVALFIFGDSFFDAGNNNYINTTALDQANFRPYGESYFKFPTGRFSDGRLVSDFIAEYAKLPLIPPFLEPGFNEYMNGANFASAGAGALVETFQGEVISLKTQLGYFKKVEGRLKRELGKVEAKKTLSRAVYLFSIGTNDYMSPLLTKSTLLSSYSHSQYVSMVIGNFTSVIHEIYKMGGRKFGFINLAPLGCFPGLRVILNNTNTNNYTNCLQEEVSLLAKLHNNALFKTLSEMEKTRFKDFRYSQFDFSNNLIQRISRPSKYGFSEGQRACCGSGKLRGIFSCGGTRVVSKKFELCKDPNKYVFWDSFHLTERAYKQIAVQMWNNHNNNNVGSYNLKQLLQCL